MTDNTTAMPLDAHRNPVPALRYRAGLCTKRTGAAAATAAIIALDSDTKFISLKTTGEIRVVFGDESAAANANTGHGFLAGEIEVVPVADPVYGKQEVTCISIYFVEDATVYVSERR